MVGKSDGQASRFISKSDFMNFRKCPAYAWMLKHRPDDVPDEMDPLSIRRMASGFSVEELAYTLYPGGVRVNQPHPVKAAETTQDAIAAGATTLFQAAVLTSEGFLARADILVRVDDMWDLIEVKASASVDADHRADVAFQTLAFSQAGYLIRNVGVLHLDRTYRRDGEIDPAAMLKLTDLTPRIDRSLAEVAPQVHAAFSVLMNGEVRPECMCHHRSKSQRCPAFGVLHPEIPSDKTVYDIAYITSKNLRKAVERGVTWQADWPAEIALPAPQRRQIEMLKTGKAILDLAALQSFLGTFTYPLHFLDYETADSAIPQFDRYRPWMKIPFQYSLHVVQASGEMEHRSFLWQRDGVDPVAALTDQLLRDIGPEGTIIAWNKPFEAGCHITMAEVLPDSEPQLLALNDRLIDLGDVVSKGMWLHPEFGGRWSIKVVLPVAAPDLSYQDLPIGNGRLASAEWSRCMLDRAGVTDDERAAIFAALLDYCELDTLAMVRIWQHVTRLVENAS